MDSFWDGFQKEAFNYESMLSYVPAAVIGGVVGGVGNFGIESFRIARERAALSQSITTPFEPMPLAQLTAMQGSTDRLPEEWQNLHQINHELARAKAITDLDRLEKNKTQRKILSVLKGAGTGASSLVATAYKTRPK